MVFHRSLLRKPENPKADIFWGYLKISSFMQNAIGSYICLDKICALQSALQTCYKSVNILLTLHICIIWIVQQLAELLVSAAKDFFSKLICQCLLVVFKDYLFKELKEVLVVFKTLYQILYQVIGFADSRVLGFFGSRGFSGSQVLGFSGSRVLGSSGSQVLGFSSSRVLLFFGFWVIGLSGSPKHYCTFKLKLRKIIKKYRFFF